MSSDMSSELRVARAEARNAYGFPVGVASEDPAPYAVTAQPMRVPEVQAGELLLLLAARGARLMALSDGTLTEGAIARWEDSLSEAQRRALDDFDALIRANRKHLSAAQRAPTPPGPRPTTGQGEGSTAIRGGSSQTVGGA